MRLINIQLVRALVTLTGLLSTGCTNKSTVPAPTLLSSSLSNIHINRKVVALPTYSEGLLPPGKGPDSGIFQKPCASRPGKAHPDQGSGVCTGNNYIEVVLPTAELSLSYNSQSYQLQRGFGYGFSLSIDDQYLSNEGLSQYTLLQGDGSIISHHQSKDAEWVSDDVRLFRSVFQSSSEKLVQLLPEGEKAEYSLLSSSEGTKQYVVTRLLDRNGNSTEVLRNAEGLITKVADSFGNEIQISYSNGLASSLKDFAGNLYSFKYDEGKRLVEVTQPDGRAWLFGYKNHLPWITESKEAGGKKLQYSYYVSGDLESIKNELGYVTALYYEPSEVKVKTSLDTEVEKFDSQGRILSHQKNGVTTTYTRDANGLLISEKDPVGLVTNYTYTSTDGLWDPRPSSIIYPNNRGTITFVQKGGLRPEAPTEVTHIHGSMKSVTKYDAVHEGVIQIVKGSLGQDVTNISYDAKGNPLVTTRNGVVEEKLTYDSQGRVVTKSDAFGLTSNYTYDSKGNLASKRDHFGRVTSYQYDGLGNATEVVSSTRKATQEYDPMGAPVGKSSLQSTVSEVPEISSQTSVSYQASGAPDKVSIIDTVGGELQSIFEALFDLLPGQLSSRVIKSSDGTSYDPDK